MKLYRVNSHYQLEQTILKVYPIILWNVRLYKWTTSIYALVLSLIIFSVPVSVTAENSDDYIEKSVENVMGEGWLPLVPPKTSFNIGSPAVIKNRKVVPLCDDGDISANVTQEAFTNVKLTFSVSANLRLEAFLGKSIVKWLANGGVLAEAGVASTISVTIDTIENRESSVVNLRRLEKNWSLDCQQTIKEEWDFAEEKPFSIQSVSYWTNTRIEAYDETGARLKLSAESSRINVKADVDGSAETKNQYMVVIPGTHAIAVKPWRIRKRFKSLGTDGFILEVDSKNFDEDAINSLYHLLE